MIETERPQPKVKVAKVSLNPVTKLLTYLNGVHIPLDDTGNMVLRFSEPRFTTLMAYEPGETFLFEWEGRFGRHVPAGIQVAGLTLAGTKEAPFLHTDSGERVGEYHTIIDTAERKVVFAHIVTSEERETR